MLKSEITDKVISSLNEDLEAIWDVWWSGRERIIITKDNLESCLLGELSTVEFCQKCSGYVLTYTMKEFLTSYLEDNEV